MVNMNAKHMKERCNQKVFDKNTLKYLFIKCCN